MLDEPTVIKYEITFNSYFVPDNVNCWAKGLDEHFTFAFQDYEKKSLPNTIKEEYYEK